MFQFCRAKLMAKAEYIGHDELVIAFARGQTPSKSFL